MFTADQIKKNKERFIELIRGINREGADIEGLVNKLENSDFFCAPASHQYHNACEGGLCAHCLNVYDELEMMIHNHDFTVANPDGSTSVKSIASEDAIRITALLHDISKMNFYVSEVKNKKVYSSAGSKHDSMGNYDWVSVPGYGYRKDAFIYGNHEQNSVYMTSYFIPMMIEEEIAILHHMGGMAWDSAKDNISAVYSKYPLAMYLHLADMSATYMLESNAE